MCGAFASHRFFLEVDEILGHFGPYPDVPRLVEAILCGVLCPEKEHANLFSVCCFSVFDFHRIVARVTRSVSSQVEAFEKNCSAQTSSRLLEEAYHVPAHPCIFGLLWTVTMHHASCMLCLNV